MCGRMATSVHFIVEDCAQTGCYQVCMHVVLGIPAEGLSLLAGAGCPSASGHHQGA